MAGGLVVTDCASSSWAWLDVGCLLQNLGTTVGGTLTSALEPVWIVLGILAVLIIIILFAPNVKYIAPRISL
jgi:hypothetical protein